MLVGVGLFVKNDLKYSVRNDLCISNNELKALWIDFEGPDSLSNYEKHR